MGTAFFFRLSICSLAFFGSLYLHIQKQNEVTDLRIQIPLVSKNLRELKEQNTRLKYEIDRLESPEKLFQYLQNPHFCHLQHPLEKEVVCLKIVNEEKSQSTNTTKQTEHVFPLTITSYP
ncbi:MAG: hypothetical protein ACOVOR_04835 [Rhabdochlamydiaceae bacterium]